MTTGSDSDDFTPSELDESDARFDAALRAAFGPPSTAYFFGGGLLDELQQATGVTSQAVLLDEPSDAGPLVDPSLHNRDATAAVRGRYQVLGEIARGGMGVVLKGRDPNIGRDVALKVLHAANAHNPVMIQRFVEEAQIGGQLQHPGILPVYDFGLDVERRPYFTMRLVQGRTLAALLEERATPADELTRFLGIFEQVCQTVAYAHARGVIHRDLKPSNVMVGAYGEVQVVDWGLAKVIGRRRADASGQSTADTAAALAPDIATVRSSDGGSHSQHGSILGTPAYMSPEQARGEVDDLAPATDVFALGACLCEILTGKPPYIGSRAEVLDQAAACRLEPAFERLDPSGADAELIHLAKRCLDSTPAARPRHAGILAREIKLYLASLGDRMRSAEIAAAEARASAAAERQMRRRTTWLAAALAIAVAAGAAFAVRAERERGARAAQSVAEAAALYPKAIWFRAQADSVPAEFLPEWAEALDHVRRTAEVIRNGATDRELRTRIDEIIASLEQEEANVEKRIEASEPSQ
jgi:tRNA A-37 threonylcarbamoyl transferase component Bud32